MNAALAQSPRTQAMLRDSLGRILYATPSPERATSLAEREMREINRSTDVGALWTVRGVQPPCIRVACRTACFRSSTRPRGCFSVQPRVNIAELSTS